MRRIARTDKSMTIETDRSENPTVFRIYERNDGSILVTCTDGVVVVPRTETGVLIKNAS